ncbi:MAG: hypothetical protein COV47_02290 [Candidatus Diapherotrites archaeon CG11_big_fil_rev_8_21_14_0_20_37_9]|nr:MAG: hypothetical protein COV47_02290 [Candidatus Diapherotrites archaeon CG11_big_fil_rev_8_21_14_0_20_37_9]
MGQTKKVGSAGRFGSRYGVGIRKKLLKVEDKQKEAKECPNCGSPAVKRKSAGIFNCSKCGHEFVGGAYFTRTLTGKIISKIVSQKSFASSTKDLHLETPVAAPAVEKPAKPAKKEKGHKSAKAEAAEIEIKTADEIADEVTEQTEEEA